MRDNHKEIVVTGIGVISPYGIGQDNLEAGLLSGRCCLESSTGFYPGFEGAIAQVRGLAPLEHLPHFRPSRTDQLAVVAARDALATCGDDYSAFSESGIVMASTVAGLTEISLEIVQDPAFWYRKGGLSRAASYPVAHVADAIGEYLGIYGPRLAVNVACASGAMSIALAANMLLDDMVTVALAGGSDALCPFTLSGFNALQALDQSPCRPFDKGRTGLNLGEGAAVLVLETLKSASDRHARILAVLRGWAMTNDAFHPTAPHDQGRGLAACMLSAMKMAGVTPDEIGYVNAHGTGTPLNDRAETKAYESAFGVRNRPIPVSSTKSYFGHCLGAAGALEAVSSILSLKHGILPPTANFLSADPACDLDVIPNHARTTSVEACLSNSFAFGGLNAVLAFKAIS
jgi:3-oxoacyl-(acyl-carrier-protein) synthase